MLPSWISYGMTKTSSRSTLRDIKLSFYGSQANGVSRIPEQVMDFLSLISHFQHGHFTLAQTVDRYKIGQALNSLRFGCKLVKLPKMQV